MHVELCIHCQGNHVSSVILSCHRAATIVVRSVVAAGRLDRLPLGDNGTTPPGVHGGGRAWSESGLLVGYSGRPPLVDAAVLRPSAMGVVV